MTIIPFFDKTKYPSAVKGISIMRNGYDDIDKFLADIKHVIFRDGFSSSELFETWNNSEYIEFGIMVDGEYISDNEIDFINWSKDDIKMAIYSR